MEILKKDCPIKEGFLYFIGEQKGSYRESRHVPKVWDKFEIKTMKDYHDFSLKCDVLLIVVVFEKIRNNSIKNLRKAEYDKS